MTRVPLQYTLHNLKGTDACPQPLKEPFIYWDDETNRKYMTKTISRWFHSQTEIIDYPWGHSSKKKFKREQVYVRVKNCFSGQTWNRGRSLRLEPVVQEGRHPSVQFLVDCFYQLLLNSMCLVMVVTIDTTLIGWARRTQESGRCPDPESPTSPNGPNSTRFQDFQDFTFWLFSVCGWAADL